MSLVNAYFVIQYNHKCGRLKSFSANIQITNFKLHDITLLIDLLQQNVIECLVTRRSRIQYIVYPTSLSIITPYLGRVSQYVSLISVPTLHFLTLICCNPVQTSEQICHSDLWKAIFDHHLLNLSLRQLFRIVLNH